MDESTALSMIADRLDFAGDDAAVVGDLVITTDMLHERTDFPEGVTRYTAGWRSVGASLSDIAAMGAEAVAAVAVYAAPRFDDRELAAFLDGAVDVCNRVDASYVGGDLDTHEEFTVASTAVGRTDSPVYRSGAKPGDHIYVTGTLGRTAAALQAFESGTVERGNDLFQFDPRVDAGRTLAPVATAMMDSSDGVARSLHQLTAASEVGASIRWADIPVAASVRELAPDADTRREWALHFGEDFELVVTAPPGAIDTVRPRLDVPVQEIGEITENGVRMDGESLPDTGYGHGE